MNNASNQNELITTFTNSEFGDIRTVEKNGEIFFVGKDVTKILGYKRATKAVRDMVDNEDTDTVPIQDSTGRKQNTPIINESGLYSLILSSKLPKAKAFKRWVTVEVIPSIRKHGAYMTPDTIEQAIANPDFLIRLATELKTEKEKRITLEKQIEKDSPKVAFANAIEISKSSILVGELAKLLRQNGIDMGQNRLYQWMRSRGYLISRQGLDYNMPTQKSMDLGLFEIKETPINTRYGIKINKCARVTGRGQTYFINKFLKTEKEGA